MTHFTVVPPRPQPKPVKLYKLVNSLIWRVHCVVAIATAIDGAPALYTDYMLKGLVDALRDAADRIEQHARHLKERERAQNT